MEPAAWVLGGATAFLVSVLAGFWLAYREGQKSQAPRIEVLEERLAEAKAERAAAIAAVERAAEAGRDAVAVRDEILRARALPAPERHRLYLDGGFAEAAPPNGPAGEAADDPAAPGGVDVHGGSGGDPRE